MVLLWLPATPAISQPVNSVPETWRQLAEQGQARAQFELGIIYEYGRGVDQNDDQAIKWYKMAAMQGFARAQYRLGVLYDNGWGIPRDDVEAVKWYRKAAEQGHPLAQHDLAFMYAEGTGVAQDYVRAYMWLSVAIANGYTMMIRHRNRIAENMTPTQIRKALRLTRQWLHSKTGVRA